MGIYKKHFAYPTICYLGSAPNAPSASAKCKSLGQPSRFFQKPKNLARVLAAIMIPVDEIGSSKDTMGQTATSEIKLGKYLTFCKQFKKREVTKLCFHSLFHEERAGRAQPQSAKRTRSAIK